MKVLEKGKGGMNRREGEGQAKEIGKGGMNRREGEVYQRGSLLDGLAMYLSCDTKKFHVNESTHIYTNTPIGGSFPPPPPGGATVSVCL